MPNSSTDLPRQDEPELDELPGLVEEAAKEESVGVAGADYDLRLTAEKAILEVEGLKIDLARAQNLHRVRKWYLGLLFGLTVLWLAMVVVFVFFAGFRYGNFVLSDSVLVAFITSTTVSVLGLFHFAAKWLYPSSN